MVAYSFKKRFVVPIKIGLGMPYEIDDIVGDLEAASRPKRQTIRANGKRRHARPDEILQLYTAMRTRQCKLIGTARCVAVHDIVIAFGDARQHGMAPVISIDGEARYLGLGLNDFARLDGFEDWSDMLAFWKDEHGIDKPFSGVLIKWEPLS